MIIEKGRPKDVSQRLNKEIKCYDLLDKLSIEYERADHTEAQTMEVCAEIEKEIGIDICKNLFLCNRQQTVFYLLMIPSDKKFLTKDLSAQIGSSRLSFANAEAMEKYLDITPGSVSVLGLMNDKDNSVNLLIDEDLLKNEYVGCHPCINTSTLKINTDDLIDKILPEIKHGYKTVKL